MILKKIFVFTVATLCMRFSYGQTTVDHLQMESKIAEQMKTRIESVIATQLDEETFNVSVSVSLNKVPKQKQKPEERKPKKPKIDLDEPDLFIGLLDIDQILESYEEEIAELQQQKAIAIEQKEKPESSFQLSRMSVRVGLHEKYGREYFNEFNNWLTGYVNDQYGNIASVQTEYIAIATDKSILEDKNKEEKKRNIASEKPPVTESDTFDNRTLYEKMRDFQSLLFGFLLFLVGIFLIVTFKAMKSRDSFLPKTFRLDIPPLQVSNPIAENNKNSEEEEPTEDFSDIISSIERITHKLGILCFDLGNQLKLIKSAWLRQQDGDLKLALLFDAMIVCREKAVELFGEHKASLWIDALKINENSKVKMEHAFSEMADYHPQEKLELLEAMYWDLMTLKMLGPEAYHKPFSILEEVPEKYLETILNSQDRKTRNIALLYMDKSKKNKILGNMSYEQRRDLIKDTLRFNKIQQNEFSDIESAIKLSARSIKMESESSHVELYPKISRILSDLDPIEEIKLLREIISELPNDGEKLKRSYTTWAFFDEWDINLAPRVVSKLRPQVITQLVRLMPSFQSHFLSCCPDGLRVMVESDLSSDYRPSIEEQRKLLLEAKRHLLKFLNKEDYALKDLYDQPILGESYGQLG